METSVCRTCDGEAVEFADLGLGADLALVHAGVTVQGRPDGQPPHTRVLVLDACEPPAMEGSEVQGDQPVGGVGDAPDGQDVEIPLPDPGHLQATLA